MHRNINKCREWSKLLDIKEQHERCGKGVAKEGKRGGEEKKRRMGGVGVPSLRMQEATKASNWASRISRVCKRSA